MHKKLLLTLILLLLFSLSTAPAAANSPCETVDFYVYNSLDVLIDFEANNWTPGSTYYTWYGYLAPGAEARFSLSPGAFEFYASDVDYAAWYLDEMHEVTACSKVAVYVKMVGGEPAFKIKILP